MKNLTKITCSTALLALMILPTTSLAWGNDNDYYWRSNVWRPHTCACANDIRSCPASYRLVCNDCGKCKRVYRHSWNSHCRTSNCYYKMPITRCGGCNGSYHDSAYGNGVYYSY